MMACNGRVNKQYALNGPRCFHMVPYYRTIKANIAFSFFPTSSLKGLALTVEQAFGLPGNTSFVNVLVFVSPGQDVQRTEATEEGHGGEEKALIKTRDFNSYQKSPKWIDSPTVSNKKNQLYLPVCSYQTEDLVNYKLFTPRVNRDL